MSAAPQKAKPGAEELDVTVSAVVPLNELVTRFEFKRNDGSDFPPFSGGAQIAPTSLNRLAQVDGARWYR